jgi:hypothetical protein
VKLEHTVIYLHLSRRHLHAVANPLDTMPVSGPDTARPVAAPAEAVTRPPFEVADIIRQHGDRFIETHGAWLTSEHRRVLRALARCRTAALGGHLDRCVRCDHRASSYNSCRNRHCPKCLTHARDQWLAARQQELLPVGYHHVVFTLPHDLSWLALQNKTIVYDLLFHASAATLLEVAADPKHLGAAIGFLSGLHTSGQNVLHHPHAPLPSESSSTRRNRHARSTSAIGRRYCARMPDVCSLAPAPTETTVLPSSLSAFDFHHVTGGITRPRWHHPRQIGQSI